MRYFPISIDTREKKILVIGGGKVAFRKIQSLLSSELEFYIIAEEFNQDLLNLSKEHPDRIHLNALSIDEGFVFYGYDLLLLATNNPSLNQSLEERARSRGILCLRCDKSQESSFILNKVIDKGSLVASISTGGKNPTITKIVAKDIEGLLDQYDPKKIEILNQIREALVKKNKENIPQIIQSLWDEETIRLNDYLEDVDEIKIRDKGQ